MNEAKQQAIRQWLSKSQRDIGSARRLMEGDEPYLDTAVYHCQQAAEKALKAYLISKDIVYEKTHNLVALVASCVPLEAEFRQLEELAVLLTPYATAFHYPGDVLEPEPAEAAEALAAALAFVAFVQQRLDGD